MATYFAQYAEDEEDMADEGGRASTQLAFRI